MNDVRFDGKVAVVTGSGRNIGRAFALALAERGAKVVVNDLGIAISDTDGSGQAPAVNPAHGVVDEIREQGGEAVVNTDTVATRIGGKAIIQTALEAFGTVDIVINNAGVVRTAPFVDFTDELLDPILDTQIRSIVNVSQPAWKVMAAKGGGRILNMSSGAAVGAVPNHILYGAAKMAVIGMTRGMAGEGKSAGINVNALAPYAKTRPGTPFGPVPWSAELEAWLSADQISPTAVWLVHDSCTTTGEVFHIGAGYVAKVVVGATAGWFHRDASPEDVRDNFDQILDTSAIRETGIQGAGVVGDIMKRFARPS